MLECIPQNTASPKSGMHYIMGLAVAERSEDTQYLIVDYVPSHDRLFLWGYLASWSV